MKLSDLTLSTPPSGIRAVFNRIAESRDVISFALGEPDMDTPQLFIDAAKASMDLGRTHYTPNAGITDLRTAVADSYGGRNISPEQVVVTAGATEALLLTFMTLLNPGEEVIVTEPYWPTYLGQIKAVGGVPRFVRAFEEDGFVMKKERMEAAVNGKTRMILVNSPANPTGAVLGEEDLRAIAELAVCHDLIVVSDEVYHRILFDNREFHSICDQPGMKDRCIVIDSFSKTYAMTGWRVGYVVAPQAVAEAMAAMHEYGVSCIGEPTQQAAVAALRYGEAFADSVRDSFQRRRDLIVEGISGIDGLRCLTPPGAFYLYFNIEGTGMRSEDFVYRLLDQQKIALAPGSSFGSGQENYIRLSFANSEENLKTAIERIEEFVRQNT